MANDNSVPQRLARNLQWHRWLISLLLGGVGIGYTVWESILVDGYPLVSLQVLVGLALLGVITPLLAFGTLTWAWQGAQSWEHAEQERERQRQHLIALNQISASVNQSLNLDAVLNNAIDRVLEVLCLSSGEMRLIKDGHLELCAARGVSPAFVNAERVIPLGHCICGQSAERGQLIAVEEIGKLPDAAGAVCACEQFRSVLSVPVRTAERVIGVIHVASHTPRPFDSQDRALLTSIGYLVGTAVEKARLHTQLSELNQELEARVVERTAQLQGAKEELAQKAQVLSQVLAEERRVEEKTRARIAHDLHDGIRQLIVGALYEIQSACEAALQHPDTISARLLTVQDLLRRIESEMRSAIYSLRPLALDAQGLMPAIRECVARFERVSGVSCELKVEGTTRRLATDVEVAVFRIVQEALNNVEAHARAHRVRVGMQFDRRGLAIEVSDDGVGFDAGAIKDHIRAHLGLIGMRERAESVGGALEIASRAGEGTRVCLRVPVRSEA